MLPSRLKSLREIFAGEVEVARDRLAPELRTGPILADQGALEGNLAGIAVGEAEPVAGGEEQGGRSIAAEQGGQSGFGGIVFQNGLHLPTGYLLAFCLGEPLRLGGGDLLRQGFDQELRAHARGAVVAVADAEEGCARRQAKAALCLADTLGVAGVVIDLVEVDAPDGVLDIQLVLEAVGDGDRVADDEQVVGHLIGVGGSGSHAVSFQELVLALTGAIAIGAGEDLEARTSLFFAQGEQRRQGFLQGRVGVVGEDGAPASGAQVAGVGFDAGVRILDVELALFQLVDGRAVERLPLRQGGYLARGHLREEIAAGGGVQAVEDPGLIRRSAQG